MEASCARSGQRGTGLPLLLLVVVTLSSTLQLASAQNYTALRDGVVLPPQCSIDNATATTELEGLLLKLPQVKGTRAESQLQFLSASSRSKLNNLTGNAAEWLRNRTDLELEQLFENIRAENFRRMMAMSAIGTQLRGAFTSSNVLRSLELLQTEDLERLASLPLFEERYQKLTNVTFLALLRQLYGFGLTQVPQRTCVLTAGNTSALSRLPTTDAEAAATAASGNEGGLPTFSALSALKTDSQTPVVSYSLMPNDGRLTRGRRLQRRRSLLSVFSDWAGGGLDFEEAAAAVVREATRGPGSAAGSSRHARRMLLQETGAVTPSTMPSEHTLAPIVLKFLEGIGDDGSMQATTDGDQDSSLLGSASGIPGVPTQPGFLDSRAVTTGCTENLGLFRVRSGSVSSASTRSPSSSSTQRTGSGSSSISGSTRTATTSNKNITAIVPSNSSLPLNCTDGLVLNGTSCVPCPAGSVAQNGTCVCANGTALNATTGACDPLPPCGNATLANGTLANGTRCALAGQPPAPPPCINGTLPNGTQCIPPTAQAPLAAANTSVLPDNATVIAGTMPTLNGTSAVNTTNTTSGSNRTAVAGPFVVSLPGNGSTEGILGLSPLGLVNVTQLPSGPGLNASAQLPAITEGQVGGNGSSSLMPAGVPPAEAVLPQPGGPDAALNGSATQQPGLVALNPTAPVDITADSLAVGNATTAPGITAVDPAVAALQPPAAVAPAAVGDPAVTDPAALVAPVLATPVAPVEVTPTVVTPATVPPPEVPTTPAAVAPVVEVPPPVNCAGSWAEAGVCNAPCEGTGTKTSVFTVTTPAANGGAECEAASGATREVPCSNPTPCPKPVEVAAAPVAPVVEAPVVVPPPPPPAVVEAPVVVEPPPPPPAVVEAPVVVVPPPPPPAVVEAPVVVEPPPPPPPATPPPPVPEPPAVAVAPVPEVVVGP